MLILAGVSTWTALRGRGGAESEKSGLLAQTTQQSIVKGAAADGLDKHT